MLLQVPPDSLASRILCGSFTERVQALDKVDGFPVDGVRTDWRPAEH
jgi:hypothetical protein